MMLMLNNTPGDAYRRVTVDARIRGAKPQDLVSLCFEQLVSELGRAIHADEAGDMSRRSDALTRALAALTALEMGLDRNAPLAEALDHLYAAAREAILSSVVKFDVELLSEVKQDFAEIGDALSRSANSVELENA